MSTSTTEGSDRISLPLVVPASVAAEIEHEAASFGLRPSAYLVLLHAISSGKVPPSIGRSVREIFTKDRAILQELAK